MALARVVSFEGIDNDRIASLKQEMETGERPDNLPATEMLVLHDPTDDRALAIIFFDNEEDYAVGNATLDAMPTGDTPGRRTSVSKYEVAIHTTA